MFFSKKSVKFLRNFLEEKYLKKKEKNYYQVGLFFSNLIQKSKLNFLKDFKKLVSKGKVSKISVKNLKILFLGI